ncbi:hypothetical protein HanXRQr2_Chr13g0597471 [Helianthus annuus]|uniref:Uncharacterized protein n=1 Tax=Helianthus annuus TaxID=4232 RepID=A0A251SUG2_HELAN|nr:hypothetical protein HanXRQr2_Chr13g0597471 [Helianthus annuus]KAJ0671881.1 hypothetical protein HanOQP8_Chr13g0490701 [Helianthus annuus]KAJ0850000.1 hypothetical protein HanPSC8_Chr13g0575521 [Helianthus annuus]
MTSGFPQVVFWGCYIYHLLDFHSQNPKSQSKETKHKSQAFRSSFAGVDRTPVQGLQQLNAKSLIRFCSVDAKVFSPLLNC